MKGAVVTIYPKRGLNDSRRDFSRPNSLPEERAGVVPRPVCDGVSPRRNISLLSYYPVSTPIPNNAAGGQSTDGEKLAVLPFRTAPSVSLRAPRRAIAKMDKEHGTRTTMGTPTQGIFFCHDETRPR